MSDRSSRDAGRRPLRARVPVACAALAAIVVGMYGCSLDERRGRPPLIPMTVFFMNPARQGYQISPDGRRVAYLAPWEYRLNLFVEELDAPDVEPRRLTGSTERDILGHLWSDDGRIVYALDPQGIESLHLYAVDVAGGETVDLTPFEDVRIGVDDRPRDDPRHMLINMNRRDPALFDSYRLDVVTGELDLAGENPGDILAWRADNRGRVRAAVASREGRSRLLYREDESAPFRPILEFELWDDVQPLFFTFDDRRLYVQTARGREHEAFYELDPATGELGEMIYGDDGGDVEMLFRSFDRRRVVGASIYADRRTFVFSDSLSAWTQATLDERLSGYEALVVSMSDDEDRLIVRASSDKSLGAYYLFERESGLLRKLADVSPWLDESHMADMEPVSFVARDSLAIRGYLTLPRGVPARDLPAVIMPNANPWTRDRWGYVPHVQFLANRGYAVLQVNYRGTSGLGQSYFEQGFGEWGRAMSTDLEDAALWLCEQGIADRDRLALFGRSVGGYLALASTMSRPDLWRCTVSYSGMTDILDFVVNHPPFWDPIQDYLHRMIGHPERDADRLREVSPAHHPERFTVPLLVAQGVHDPWTSCARTDSFVASLEDRGADVTYLRLADEGHEFLNTEGKYALYREVERFLAAHLGGRAEPVP